jgi:NAD(P)-dependent dehydrogenase (short-subunit alcohol dehydrogenase family)
MVWKRLIDAALEVPVAPSFTRLGYDVRKATEGWSSLDDLDLAGRVVLLTGGTSGIGRAAAAQLARCGASVTITGRSPERTASAAAELSAETGVEVHAHAADMGELDQVRALADHMLTNHDRLNAVIQNAGALAAERALTSAGFEATVASQVYGPFLLTNLLLDRLVETANDARRRSLVLTMSSGGMYAAPLTIKGLEMSEADYNGTNQYAIAKRAQVTLNEMWADRFGGRGVQFHAAHPGWADTPGVADALPGFGRFVGPLLRTPEQGADTIVWLTGAPEALEESGGFWHDRRRRSIHKTPFSHRADTAERRRRLWDVVEAAALRP